MITNNARVAILTDDLELVDLPTGCYGYGSWYWGLHEALRDVYVTVFPIHSDSSDDFRAVDHYVGVSGGTVEETVAETYACSLCEWAHESLDRLLYELNEAIEESGYVFFYESGELYLGAICESAEEWGEEECGLERVGIPCAYHFTI